MIHSYWKGQIACVSELLIEHERLSGVCFPQFYGMPPKGGTEAAGYCSGSHSRGSGNEF